MLEKVGQRPKIDYQNNVFKQPENSYITSLLSKLQEPEDKVNISSSKKVISFSGHNYDFKQSGNVFVFTRLGKSRQIFADFLGAPFRNA